MKHAPFVCLIALSLTASLAPRASAQTPAMTKGVSVEMAQTKTAAAWGTLVKNGDPVEFGQPLFIIE